MRHEKIIRRLSLLGLALALYLAVAVPAAAIRLNASGASLQASTATTVAWTHNDPGDYNITAVVATTFVTMSVPATLTHVRVICWWSFDDATANTINWDITSVHGQIVGTTINLSYGSGVTRNGVFIQDIALQGKFGSAEFVMRQGASLNDGNGSNTNVADSPPTIVPISTLDQTQDPLSGNYSLNLRTWLANAPTAYTVTRCVLHGR